MNHIDIANTIKNQIGVSSLMCMGANNFMAIPGGSYNYGGLFFKIGRNPKMNQGGTCGIVLNFNDTYTVTIISARGKELLNESGVYCDSIGGRYGIIEQITG